jgi:phage shock protein PspC (stress-responsive transcriptional regulator)
VIIINLNGVAYQLDESAYDALLAYLDHAAAQLAGNPDRAEIIADLEQAIADKCHRYLGSHKNVVTAAEIEDVLREMGPVDAGSDGSDDATDEKAPGAERTTTAGAPKRLYRIGEGAMLSGVCNGLAAFIGIDVTIVRIAFVALAFLTRGIAILGYGVLMLVIPSADTSEERAAAHGAPFNAQRLIDQAKKNYAGLKDGKAWRRQWRQHHREWRRQWRQTMREQRWAWWAAAPQPAPSYAAQIGTGVLMPVIVLVSAGVFLILAFAIISLVNTHTAFGWMLPADVPVWAAILIAFVAYHILMSPLHAARHAAMRWYGWYAAWDGVLWLAVMVLFVWLALTYMPGARQTLHQFIQNIPAVWHDFRRSVDSMLH